MLNPGLEELVCDPACGSGEFLIYSMRHVFDFIETRWDDPDDRAEQRKDYAQSNLLGIDNDHRLIRVAKAYMIMENDGRAGVVYADSLDYDAWELELRSRVVGGPVTKGSVKPGILVDKRGDDDGVNVILTNPPFAGTIRTESTLRQYELAMDKKAGGRRPTERAKLFLERCVDILKPGGRVGIVLPQGVFNNINDQGVRQFVGERCRILAVVGLHPYTFKPFTLAKTSILFLQKWKPKQALDSYEVFTAVSMRPGKTKLGRPQYLDDGITLDCDMPDITAAFRRWAKKQRLDFAV